MNGPRKGRLAVPIPQGLKEKDKIYAEKTVRFADADLSPDFPFRAAKR
jgi:hypothetical protein